MISKSESIREILPRENFLTFEQMNIINNSQRLWLRSSLWMRDFIISTMRDPERQPIIIKRLFEELPLDFYNTFRFFYGHEIAQELLNLISSFIIYTWRLAEAVKNNDTEAVNTNTVSWYQKADEIAAFLSSINIYWDESQWKNLLYQYIRLKIEQIVAIAGNNFEREMQIYDEIENLNIVIGNYLARGFIASSLATPQTPNI